MAFGKYLSFEEARKQKRLDRFCGELPSEGDENAFDELHHLPNQALLRPIRKPAAASSRL